MSETPFRFWLRRGIDLGRSLGLSVHINDERFAESSQGMVKQTLSEAGSEVRSYTASVTVEGGDPVTFALKEPRRRKTCGMGWATMANWENSAGLASLN